MKNIDREFLLSLAIMFETAERQGDEKDEPEGSRYILFSDTAARIAAWKLRQMHEESVNDH